MNFLNILKTKISNVSGYWIYKKKHLPIGIDLFLDLENRFLHKEINTIFDVGANTGQSLVKFKSNFSKARIFSFEPVRDTFLELMKNSKQFEEVYCKNIGLGSMKGQFLMNIEKCSQWNSLVAKSEIDRKENQELVEIETIDSFMTIQEIDEIDLLKIDTEGFDLEVLKGAVNALTGKKISFIYCEMGFNPDDTRHIYLNDLMLFLKQYGYYFYSIYDIRGEGTLGCYGNSLFTCLKGKALPNNI